MQNSSLKELYVEELRDIYDAETTWSRQKNMCGVWNRC
jgi:ferritin-like metal-binding protein YciE